jgi:hypothetical protein
LVKYEKTSDSVHSKRNLSMNTNMKSNLYILCHVLVAIVLVASVSLTTYPVWLIIFAFMSTIPVQIFMWDSGLSGAQSEYERKLKNQENPIKHREFKLKFSKDAYESELKRQKWAKQNSRPGDEKRKKEEYLSQWWWMKKVSIYEDEKRKDKEYLQYLLEKKNYREEQLIECQTEDGKRKDKEDLEYLLKEINYYERGFVRGFLNMKKFGLVFLTWISVTCVIFWFFHLIHMIDF